MQLRDILSINDLSKEEILGLLELTKLFKKEAPPRLLEGKILATCFYEPSTRTRLSFEAAMYRLGGQVIGFSEPKASSFAKGESLYDSMRIIGAYADAIVLRHPLEGAARQAADATSTPVINAGDGGNQHPTQTLVDLFTMLDCQSTLEGLSIAFVGDLKFSRTIHSLALACRHFSMRVYFVAPESLFIADELCDVLRRSGLRFSFHKEIQEVLPKLDILYMTRLQKERFNDLLLYEKLKNRFVLRAEDLKLAQGHMRVLHPLPRQEEIHPDVDDTAFAHYFQQSDNGLYLRQALLATILSQAKERV